MLKLDLRPANLAVGSHRIHYGWVIVAVASAMWMVTSSIRFASSVLVPYLHDPDEGLGWSYFAIFSALALQWVFAAMFSPVVGWLGDRYGVRRIMGLGAAVFAVGMALTGAMTHLWQFYLFFGVILALSMSIFQVPMVAAVTIWFQKRLGLAIGILQGAQGIGTAAAIVLISLILNFLDFRWAFWIPGIAGGAVLFLLIRLFHNEPGEIGIKPLGASLNDPVERLLERSIAKVRTSEFLRHAQRTSAFWNLIGIHFWGCAGHNIVLMFLVAMAVDRGHSQASATGILVVLTVVSTLTRFGVPIVADRMGSKGAMAVCFALQTFPVLMLLFAQDLWVFYLFAIIFGVGIGGEMSAFPIINRQYYGNAPIGTTYGWQLLGGGMGMALGLPLGGLIWDATGSFGGAVWLSFALSTVGVVSIWLLPSTSHHLIPHWEESLPPEARSSASL